MIICPECGEENPQGSKFCRKCGINLVYEEPEPEKTQTRAKKVTVDGESVSLTPTEYEILHLLMKTPGKVFSPREIYSKVWRDNPYGAESTVAVHIRHLREKIEINPAEPRYLKVVWGQGYKMKEV